MPKRPPLYGISEDEEDQDLRDMLQKYIKKSEELQRRESLVLKQVEMVQSAVASLQAWNESRRASTATESVKIDLKEVEEETEKIREETERIQKEVREKIEENKKLQNEIDKRKEKSEKSSVFVKMLAEEDRIRRTDKIDSRLEITNPSSENDSDPGYQFLNKKLQKLKEMEKRLKKESEEELEEGRQRKEDSKEKYGWPKWESKADERLVETWKKTLEKK